MYLSFRIHNSGSGRVYRGNHDIPLTCFDWAQRICLTTEPSCFLTDRANHFASFVGTSKGGADVLVEENSNCLSITATIVYDEVRCSIREVYYTYSY